MLQLQNEKLWETLKIFKKSKPCFDWQKLMVQLGVLYQCLVSYLLLPW